MVQLEKVSFEVTWSDKKVKSGVNAPMCSHKGCKRIAQNMSVRCGIQIFRKISKEQIRTGSASGEGYQCQKHYFEYVAQRNGITHTEFISKINLKTAKKNGFNNIADYKNSTHDYRQYRKDYCENRDGHVTGKPCTFTDFRFKKVLQVDHIDGNPGNNDPKNLQTLCSNCHCIKGMLNGDHKTPGRKKLGIKK